MQCSREKKIRQWGHHEGHKQRARCLPFRRRYRHEYNTKIYQSSRSKTLSGIKNISFPDFTCTYGRMLVYGRYAPEFVIIIDLILSLNCPFPTSRNPHFGNEGKCKNFLVKMSFICMKKKHFPINGLASSLALKHKLRVTWNGLLEHIASKFQFLSRNQRTPLTGSILASINPNVNVLDHQNGEIDRWINYQLKTFVSFLFNIFELSMTFFSLLRFNSFSFFT